MTIIAMGPESAHGDRAVVISYHPDLVMLFENFEQRNERRLSFIRNIGYRNLGIK